MKKKLTLLIFISTTFLLSCRSVNALTSDEVEKYVWEKEVVTNISSEANELRLKLKEEIQKMINAGHLAPYRMGATESVVTFFWFHAGEPIYALSEALKYLPENDTQTKQSLLNYLKTEFNNYPPYKPTAVYDRAPWLPLDQGTRREYYPLETLTNLSNSSLQTQPIIHTFYHLWNYIDATEDTQVITNHWTEIKSLFDKLKNREGEDKAWRDRGGCITKYGDVAGCIGMARIAYLANQTGVRDEALTKILEGFNSGLDFNTFVANSYTDLRYFREDGGDDADPTALTIKTYVFMNLFPETARFLKDYNLSQTQNHLNTLVWNIPTWYATYGPGFVGGEVNFNYPIISYPMFQAYAQIVEKDAKWLEERLDVPLAKVGDLYYIQNLISTIKSYGTSCWEDIRTGQRTCEAVPIPSPTPTASCSLRPTGDADCNGVINILDFETWRREFLGIDTTTKSDFDSSGGVTILDFEVWRRSFLAS